jgi:lipoteichoic acid synthase
MYDATSRFRVPLIIWSPLVKDPKTFKGISVMSDISPSLVNLLSNNYDISKVPSEIHAISTGGLSVFSNVNSTKSVALMSNKGDLNQYISGDVYYADNQAYKVTDNKKIENYDPGQMAIKKELKNFRKINQCVIDSNLVYNGTSNASLLKLFPLTKEDYDLVKHYKIEQYGVDSGLVIAQKLAYNSQRMKARSILKYI